MSYIQPNTTDTAYILSLLALAVAKRNISHLVVFNSFNEKNQQEINEIGVKVLEGKSTIDKWIKKFEDLLSEQTGKKVELDNFSKDQIKQRIELSVSSNLLPKSNNALEKNGTLKTKKEVSKLVESVEYEEKYMFIQNVKVIKYCAEKILEMGEENINILLQGHDWAEDHASTAKDDIQEVCNFLCSNYDKIKDQKPHHAIIALTESLSKLTNRKVNLKEAKVTQSIPNKTKVKFSLKGNSAEDLADVGNGEGKYEKEIESVVGKIGIITSLETYTELGDKNYEYYNVKFDNGVKLEGISGYYLTIVN